MILERQIGALCAQLESHAVVVHDGEARIDGDVGYLAVYGGTVNLKSMTCSYVRSDVACEGPGWRKGDEMKELESAGEFECVVHPLQEASLSWTGAMPKTGDLATVTVVAGDLRVVIEGKITSVTSAKGAT